MKFFIVAVGNKMPDWVSNGYSEYIKRLPREIAVHLIEVKPEKRTSGKSTGQLLQVECQRIRSALPSGCRIVVLDELGQQWTSLKFAAVIQQWNIDGDAIAFIIGSADGLHDEIKCTANEILAISQLTLPHGLVRVILAEQLYRAVSIIKGHPYHRA